MLPDLRRQDQHIVDISKVRTNLCNRMCQWWFVVILKWLDKRFWCWNRKTHKRVHNARTHTSVYTQACAHTP